MLIVMHRLVLPFLFSASLLAAEPVRLSVDFSKPDGAWAMPALGLGQGGLQSDPMIEPQIKELRHSGHALSGSS